mgnify:FL=1
MRVNRRVVTGGLAASLASTLMPPRARAATYTGPNIVIIRFGGGVRRQETINTATSYAPHLVHRLIPEGTLIPNMMIEQLQGQNTSHSEGTLNILTGRYLAYRDAGSSLLAERLEPTAPTLFEYFRKAYDIPAHEAILINGEDRLQEEFFSFGAHRHFGIAYRSETLSLYRFKVASLRQRIGSGTGDTNALRAQLAALSQQDYRGLNAVQSPELDRFWQGWGEHYGLDGLKNPRGDRLLTELGMRALDELNPKLMMINYQDPDYVHWGDLSHYTTAISVIDAEIQRLMAHAANHEAYRDNTIYVIVPDCGRDANPLVDLPLQHHFNTRSAHEIWALCVGPGVPKGRVMDRRVDQSQIAATLAERMGLSAREAEGSPLDIFA